VRFFLPALARTASHRARGAREHKRPANWLRQEQAQELLTMLSEHSLGGIIETREGRNGGTWYCEELALAYAMYLSPDAALSTMVVTTIVQTKDGKQRDAVLSSVACMIHVTAKDGARVGLL
jgi:hypothetical protein